MIKKFSIILALLLSFIVIACGKNEESNVKVEIEEMYYFNLNSTDDLVIKCSGVTSVSDFTYNNEEVKNIVINSKGIVAPGMQISKYSYGVYEGSFKVEDKSYSFKVTVLDNRAPELIDKNARVYANRNIDLEFELYGGKIISISGDGISESSYEINGDTVTIYAQAIELLAKEENVITYTLSYVNLETHNVTEIKGEVIIEKSIFGGIIW